MQILQFDTRLEKWDTELLWQGKEEGKKNGKKKFKEPLLIPNGRRYYLIAVEMSVVCEVH